MKTKIYLLIAFVLCGCSKFLEESSQNEVRPSSVSDLLELAAGDAYCTGSPMEVWTELLTDDMQCNGGMNDEKTELSVEKLQAPFTWDVEVYEKLAEKIGIADSQNNTPNHWVKLYRYIKGCNIILDYIDKVTGDHKIKDNLRGQMLVLRGYYYFLLVNYYAWPYNHGDPAENLGVPLKLTMELSDELLPRNTVKEVYTQIEKDYLAGNEYLENNQLQNSVYRIDHIAAKGLLARMYLYMEDYGKALDYADQVIALRPGLLDLARVHIGGVFPIGGTVSVYNPTLSPEVIWANARGLKNVFYPNPATTYVYAWNASSELISLYEDAHAYPLNHPTRGDYMGDLRYRFYFAVSPIPPYQQLTGSDGKSCLIYAGYAHVRGDKGTAKDSGNEGVRSSEMYLIRAEINSLRYKETGQDSYRMAALADLNYLRKHRYDTRNRPYVNKNIADPDELISFCRDERRREMSFEAHRWFDLRRYGMPRLVHMYGIETLQEYVLEEKSPHYVLPIPRQVRERNPKLIQNQY